MLKYNRQKAKQNRGPRTDKILIRFMDFCPPGREKREKNRIDFGD
jgi:hypothetical protein